MAKINQPRFEKELNIAYVLLLIFRLIKKKEGGVNL